MAKLHTYSVDVIWTGNRGEGTRDYRAYSRDHRIEARGKTAIDGSSDPAFRGDSARWNPEELFLASLSSCHMLWYLHLCAASGIVVRRYEDRAAGEMQEERDGGGRFARVVLRPKVDIAAAADRDRARALHAEAHHKCFIANSVACPVDVEDTLTASD